LTLSARRYILGAWCIGRVIDSASSRSQVPGGFSNRNPTSYSVSLDVHVEWWSGDRLFRSFCDRGGKYTFRSRSQKVSDEAVINELEAHRLEPVRP